MGKGTIHIYVSEEDRPSLGAFGRAFLEAAEGKKVVVIQFVEESFIGNFDFIKKVEPEMKLFSFEDVRNGINYARKVLATEECNLLVLMDLPELIRAGSVTIGDLKNILEAQGETDIILTGQSPDEEISALAKKVYRFVC